MKILVEIADDKAASFLEALRGISFIKIQPLTNAKSELRDICKIKKKFFERSLRKC